MQRSGLKKSVASYSEVHYRLAIALGFKHPERMFEDLSLQEVRDWERFYYKEPWSMDSVEQTIARNTFHYVKSLDSKDKHPHLSPLDFLHLRAAKE